MTTSLNSCCERCANGAGKYALAIAKPYCFNLSCPCHTHKCKNGTIGCSAGSIEHTCHSQQKHCPNCVSPRNWNCDCSCHTKSDWAEVEAEFDREFVDSTDGHIYRSSSEPFHDFIRRHLKAAREDEKRTFDFARKLGHIEGCKAGLKEARGLVPDEGPHEECFLDSCAQCDSARGWNACRTAIINALEERMK